MASYRNNSVENRSHYQMNDNVSFSVQAPSPVHVLSNNNIHYKQEASLQPSHNNQNLRFHLQAHNQQIQTANFHILSRHYLGQQQQQQQHYQYQHAMNNTRQHMMTSNVPLNASESKFLTINKKNQKDLKEEKKVSY